MLIKAAADDLSAALLAQEQLYGAMLFGEDRGQVSILGAQITHSVIGDNSKSLALCDLDDQALADKHRLADTFFATIITGERRVIRIRQVNSQLVLAAIKILESELNLKNYDPQAHCILIEMPILNADNRLRKHLTHSRFFGAFPCYLGKFAQNHIARFLKAHKITFNQQTQEWLEYQLQADTAYVDNELQRLALYLGNGAELTLPTLETVVEPHIASRANAIVISAFAGSHQYMHDQLNGFWQTQGSPEALMATLVRYIFELFAICSGDRKTFSAEFSHFSYRQQCRQALEFWSVSRLQDLICRLPEQLVQQRLSILGSQALMTLLLMRIARNNR